MAERVYCLYRGKDQESILMQKNACHDFAEKKGWNIVGEEQEIGVSGYKVSTDDLVKLKRIRKAAERKNRSLISCWSLCMTSWDAISTKPHSSQSGLPRRASMFGASMRERS